MHVLVNKDCASPAITKKRENKKERAAMNSRESIAYACVAYRTMVQEMTETTEEQIGLLMEMLYDMYTPYEIQKVYEQNTKLDLYGSCPEIIIKKENK